MKNPFRQRTSTREQSTLVCKTSFLPPGVTTRYELTIPLNQLTSGQLLRALEKEFIFPLLRLPYLLNTKGAGANDALLSIQGMLTFDEAPLPFSFTTSTHFHDFPARDQIRFSWREQSEPPALEGLSRYDLLSREDLEVTTFCFSAEFYKNTIITRMTGFGPVAAESLIITADQHQLRISISSEGLTDIQTLPFGTRDSMNKIDQILSANLSFSFLNDYRAHQEQLA